MLSRTHTDNIKWIAYAMEKRTGEEWDFEQRTMMTAQQELKGALGQPFCT